MKFSTTVLTTIASTLVVHVNAVPQACMFACVKQLVHDGACNGKMNDVKCLCEQHAEDLDNCMSNSCQPEDHTAAKKTIQSTCIEFTSNNLTASHVPRFAKRQAVSLTPAEAEEALKKVQAEQAARNAQSEADPHVAAQQQIVNAQQQIVDAQQQIARAGTSAQLPVEAQAKTPAEAQAETPAEAPAVSVSPQSPHIVEQAVNIVRQQEAISERSGGPMTATSALNMLAATKTGDVVTSKPSKTGETDKAQSTVLSNSGNLSHSLNETIGTNGTSFSSSSKNSKASSSSDPEETTGSTSTPNESGAATSSSRTSTAALTQWSIAVMIGAVSAAMLL